MAYIYFEGFNEAEFKKKSVLGSNKFIQIVPNPGAECWKVTQPQLFLKKSKSRSRTLCQRKNDKISFVGLA